MNKVITLAMMLAFALLASAEQFETVDLEVVEGGSVGHTYFGHHEAQAMGLYPYSPEYVAAWEMVNPSKNINKVRPGIYKFPVKKVEEPVTQTETQTETKENVEDATDGGNDNGSANDERIDSGTPGPELTIGDDKFDLNRDGYRIGPERDSLETVSASPEEGRSPEQPATAQPTDLAASESALIIADLTRKNEELTIREKETEAEIVKIKQESVSALQIVGAAVKIRDEKIARLERELADKSKAEAIALGNNGSSLSSPDYFIPIISVSTVYAIGSVVIIILLIIVVLFQASQRKRDRLKAESNTQELLKQQEQEHADRSKNTLEEHYLLKEKMQRLRLRHEPFEYTLSCPGATKKSNGQDLLGEIYFPIVDRAADGTPLIQIPGIEGLERATPANIREKLLTEEHQSHKDAYVLPSSYQKQRLNGKGNRNEVKPRKIHNLPKKVEAPARAAAQ